MSDDRHRNRSDREFRELDYDTRHGFWYAAKWVIAIVLLVVVITAGLWALGVVSAPWKGKGDAYKTKESGTNRIAAQERFETMYADVIASDQRLDILHLARQAAPDSVIAQSNYTGAVAYCIDVRNSYNAEARKYTAEQFRASDLPAKLDPADPATDCKETTKEETPR